MRGGGLLRLVHGVGAGGEGVLLGVCVDLRHGRHSGRRRIGGRRRAGSLLDLQAAGQTRGRVAVGGRLLQAQAGRDVVVGRVVRMLLLRLLRWR